MTSRSLSLTEDGFKRFRKKHQGQDNPIDSPASRALVLAQNLSPSVFRERLPLNQPMNSDSSANEVMIEKKSWTRVGSICRVVG